MEETKNRRKGKQKKLRTGEKEVAETKNRTGKSRVTTNLS